MGKDWKIRKNTEIELTGRGRISIGDGMITRTAFPSWWTAEIFVWETTCFTGYPSPALRRFPSAADARSETMVIVDHDHDYRGSLEDMVSSPVFIGNRVWIGANAVITRGVSIGQGIARKCGDRGYSAILCCSRGACAGIETLFGTCEEFEACGSRRGKDGMSARPAASGKKGKEASDAWKTGDEKCDGEVFCCWSAASGLLLPRFYLLAYGSAINGMVSSVGQFMSYLTLEAGVGSASAVAPYGPLVKGDVNAILAAAREFYIRSGILYFILVAGLTFGYPYLVEGQVPAESHQEPSSSSYRSQFGDFLSGKVPGPFECGPARLCGDLVQCLGTVVNTVISITLIQMGWDCQ